jgi:hypothetical protein
MNKLNTDPQNRRRSGRVVAALLASSLLLSACSGHSTEKAAPPTAVDVPPKAPAVPVTPGPEATSTTIPEKAVKLGTPAATVLVCDALHVTPDTSMDGASVILYHPIVNNLEDKEPVVITKYDKKKGVIKFRDAEPGEKRPLTEWVGPHGVVDGSKVHCASVVLKTMVKVEMGQLPPDLVPSTIAHKPGQSVQVDPLYPSSFVNDGIVNKNIFVPNPELLAQVVTAYTL